MKGRGEYYGEMRYKSHLVQRIHNNYKSKRKGIWISLQVFGEMESSQGQQEKHSEVHSCADSFSEVF